MTHMIAKCGGDPTAKGTDVYQQWSMLDKETGAYCH